VIERPILFTAPMVRAILAGTKTVTRRAVKDPGRYENIRDCGCLSPYGQEGDRLWVKEATWWTNFGNFAGYVATDPMPTPKSKKKPSIFMRREHTRLILEVVRLGIEKLQEGLHALAGAEVKREGFTSLEEFRALWDSINDLGEKDKPAASFESNPWVWRVEFRVLRSGRV
jgi:hypothetical protein